MFGMALRSYQQKVDRLTESVTDRGDDAVGGDPPLPRGAQRQPRADFLRRFARDNADSVAGMLRDMVERASSTGPGAATRRVSGRRRPKISSAAGADAETAAALRLGRHLPHGPLDARARPALPLSAEQR